MSEPFNFTLPELAAALRTRRLDARELAERVTAHYRTREPAWNAYKTFNAALDETAAAAAAAFQSGRDHGPLQGIPVAVKDLYGVAELPIFAGMAHELPVKWQREGPLVAALRGQHAPITGKTHTVELAFGGLGTNSHWGTPRNPWDTTVHRVPGGSSSGAGVSLAQQTALLALGTDTAGSVRIPASMTGCVGLKTSYGHWSSDGIVPLSTTLDSPGLLARQVVDAAYGFAALAPRGEPVPATPAPAALRIGIGDRCLWQDCEPGIVEAVQTALTELERHGTRLIDVPLPEACDAIELLHQGNVVAAECDEFIQAEFPARVAELDPLVMARIRDGVEISAREYLGRQRRLRALAQQAATRFVDCDVIAAPTVAITPPALTEVATADGYRSRNMAALRNTCCGNSLGLCAISLPAGLDTAGLPVGLQLLAPHGHDARLLAVAQAIESVLGTAAERLGQAPLAA